MDRIVLESHVRTDGILRIEVPLGHAEAGTAVRVTVEPTERRRAMTPDEWRAWVLSMAGSWHGDFELPPLGPPEEREPML